MIHAVSNLDSPSIRRSQSTSHHPGQSHHLGGHRFPGFDGVVAKHPANAGLGARTEFDVVDPAISRMSITRLKRYSR